MKKQVRLSIQSNAGGTGKTTLAVHLAYALAQKNMKVALLELDPSGSMKRFVGLPPALPNKSLNVVFSEEFEGDYPLIPIWKDYTDKVSVIQGGSELNKSIQAIEALLPGKYHTLQQALNDYPLEADIIIMDTPATLQPMGLVALAASTHVLVTLKPEWKDTDGAAELIKWYGEKCRFLRMRQNPPKILGFVPMRVDLDGFAAHRNILGLELVRGGKGSGTPRFRKNENIEEETTLPYAIEKRMGYHCFPFIKESSDFVNASAQGQPLQIFRPKSIVIPSFKPIVDQIIKVSKES
jgi:chromosome partitioning protein